MSFTSYVIHEEVPDSMAISVPTSATPPKVSVTVVGDGSHALSTLPTKPGKDVTLEIWSAGGGGAGVAGVAFGQGGGGPGYYAAVLITAEQWAAGGEIVLGAAGAGGALNDDGVDGTDSTLTLDGTLVGTWGAGKGAVCGADASGLLGTSVFTDDITIIAERPGTRAPSAPHHTDDGGPGGKCGGPGGGAGGVAGLGATPAGVGGTPGGGGGGMGNGGASAAGGPPQMRYSFPV